MSEEEMATEAEISDAPASEEPEAEEVVEETAEAEEQEETTDEVDAEGETAEDETEKPDPSKRKLATLAYQLREQKRQNARMMRMLEQQAEKPTSSEPPKAPKIEDFDTFDEYLDARDAYKAQSSKPAPKQETEAGLSEADINFELAKDDLYANGIAKHEDFAEVVGAEDVNITFPMANALVELDDADLQVDTAYYLGSNPKEANRIAKLTPVRQIAEITKLASKMEAKRSKPAKKPSKAPAPIKPVGGSKTSPKEITPEDDFETFRKKRYKQRGI